LHGELNIAPDFVFLDTKRDIELISQANVYAVASNLLATVRCDNKGRLRKLARLKLSSGDVLARSVRRRPPKTASIRVKSGNILATDGKIW